jgi:hypothetical protein
LVWLSIEPGSEYSTYQNWRSFFLEVGFKVLTAVRAKITVFCVVEPCLHVSWIRAPLSEIISPHVRYCISGLFVTRSYSYSSVVSTVCKEEHFRQSARACWSFLELQLQMLRGYNPYLVLMFQCEAGAKIGASDDGPMDHGGT